MSARPGAAAFMLGGLRGSALIGATAAMAALLALAAQVLFERALGIEGFAQWAFLNALLTILVPVACMGANHLLLSEFYAGRLQGHGGLRDLVRYFAIWGGLGATILLAAYALAAPQSARAPLALVLLLFAAQLPIALVFPTFQARGRAGWVAAWPLAHIGLRLLVALLALAASWHFLDAVVAWTIGCVGVAALALSQVARPLHERWARRDAALTRPGPALWRTGLGFGMADMLDSLDVKLLVPLAAAWFDPVATAAAGIVVVLLSAASYFPYVLVQRVLLPAVHSARPETREGVRRMVRRLCKACVLLLAPLAVAWWFWGFDVIAALVKGDYATQARALSLLGLSALPLFVSQLAAAPHMERARTWRLLRWRVETVVLFCVASLALRGLGLGLEALVIGFAVGRAWLCLRVLAGAPSQEAA